MSAPVISETQSVLGYRQWEYFEFQPYATAGPGRWRHASAMPAGLALDEASGRIAGAAEVPGVFNVGMVAANGYEVTRIQCIGDAEGSLDGKYLALSDAAGTVGVWIDVDNSGTSAPAHGADRAIEITTIAEDDGPLAVAEAIAAALAADGAWLVRRDGATLWIYDAALGTRTAAADGDTGFTVTRQSAGAASEAVSDEQEFTIGIEAGALVPDSLPWISVDLVSGKVKADGTEISLLDAAARNKIEKGDTTFEPDALFSVKEGDDILLRVTFERLASPLDISLDALRLVVKEFETDGVLVLSTEAFEKQGVGSGTNFLLHAKFEAPALSGALSNYESAGGTVAFLLGEIEYTQINPETVGPETLVRSSATFPIRVERDLADNPPPD